MRIAAFALPPLLLAAVAVVTLRSGPPDASDTYTIEHFRKVQLSDTFYTEGANMGDINRDGTPDIIAGPFWFEGPDFSNRHAYYPPPEPFDIETYSDNFFPHAYDFDGDGWQDIFIIGFPGKEASWYRNPGETESSDWTRHIIFEGVDNESPHWIDLTGDDRPELVCIFEGRYGYAAPDWDDPAQPWTFHPISDTGSWVNFTHGMGVGDINGDGRLDVMAAQGWWEHPAEGADTESWPHHPVEFGQGGAQMHAYDVDGDGDQDVVTSLAAHDFGLAWFEQRSQNGELAFEQHLIMNKQPEENRYGVVFSEMHAIKLADMDGDGIQDIVTGKRKWSHGREGDPHEGDPPAVLYWFRTIRGENGVEFVPYLIDDASGVGVTLNVVQLNDDDLPDIVIANKVGMFVFFHERETVSQAEWEAAQPKPIEG